MNESDQKPQGLIFCRYESREFPAVEFTTDPEWGRVHEAAEGPRHTIMGDDIDETSKDWMLKKLGGA
jgi:hypothetical protein